MKKILGLLLILSIFVSSCDNNVTYNVYSSKLSKMKVSGKEIDEILNKLGVITRHHYIYFSDGKIVEKVEVGTNEYNTFTEGDEVNLIVKEIIKENK